MRLLSSRALGRSTSKRFVLGALASGALTLGSLALAGCSASRQTATVTDRPALPPAAAPPEILPDPTPVATPASTSDARYDTVRAGRFDGGKMWTFDAPPTAYFQEAYGFTPDAAWFERARLGALRFAGYCSASFVSPGGLVMTNHHCARESVTDVSRTGENLLQNGFFSRALADERKVPELYVDQLVALRDVTADVYRGADRNATREQEAEGRRVRAEELQNRLEAEAKRRDATLEVQVISLYNGARYSAYTFKRYSDVRLVMAPEVDLGFFGGDPDNFTYPRYSLDYAFFRVYDGASPLRAASYYRVAPGGVTDGMPVFVVGNPGSTNRLASLAQLAFERDYTLPVQVEAIDRRMAALKSIVEADSVDEALRNAYFELSNSRKSTAGGLGGLRDPYLMARKAAAERALQAGIDSSAELRGRFGTVLRELADVQRGKQATQAQSAAFTFFASPPFDSPILARAIYLTYLDLLRRNNAPAETITETQKTLRGFGYFPADADRELLAVRMEELQRYLGADNIVVRRVLGGRDPRAFADDLVARTALRDSLRVKTFVERGFGCSGDPAVDVAQALFGLYLTTSQQEQGFTELESSLEAALGQARYQLYGDAVPPDASFSLRIADGRVAGYEYNGTQAPPYTTFYGLYDRNVSNPGDRDFALPARWRTPPAGFDLATPLNTVTTADITGGNSGSPLLNQNLEVVGLIFDSNIEALPNDYLYRNVRGRSVAVDIRAILETLGNVYDMDRLVLELTRGTVSRTEDEADRAQ